MQEASGLVSDRTGRPFRFNQVNTLVNRIVAMAAAAGEGVFRLITHVAEV